MTGDNRVRHCSQCNLDVYNFSAMTEREIERLVATSKGQRLCGRLYRRTDGTLLTRDCQVGLRTRVRRLSRIAGAAISAAMSLGFAFAQSSHAPSSALVQIQPQSGIDVVVTDPTGAVIQGAQVHVAGKEGNINVDGKTNSVGRFALSGLDPGWYVVTADASGFSHSKGTISIPQYGSSVVTLPLTLDVAVNMGVVVEVNDPFVPTIESEWSPASQLLEIPPATAPAPDSPAAPRHPGSLRRFWSTLVRSLNL